MAQGQPFDENFNPIPLDENGELESEPFEFTEADFLQFDMNGDQEVTTSGEAIRSVDLDRNGSIQMVYLVDFSNAFAFPAFTEVQDTEITTTEERTTDLSFVCYHGVKELLPPPPPSNTGMPTLGSGPLGAGPQGLGLAGTLGRICGSRLGPDNLFHKNFMELSVTRDFRFGSFDPLIDTRFYDSCLLYTSDAADE